jgi:hypothetical protein
MRENTMPANLRKNSRAISLAGFLFVLAGASLLVFNQGLSDILSGPVRADSWAAVIALLPSLGRVVLQEAANLAFSPHALFTGLSQLLLSFWPLVLVGAGTALLLGRAESRN